MTGQFFNFNFSYLYSKYNLKRENNSLEIAHADLMFVRSQGQSTFPILSYLSNTLQQNKFGRTTFLDLFLFLSAVK